MRWGDGGSKERLLSPLRGWFQRPNVQLRLAPWAAFFRRFAAGIVAMQYSQVASPRIDFIVFDFGGVSR
jgi:hypothetical protein